MVKSSRPERRPGRESGRFIVGEYSPARRSSVSPAAGAVPPRASAYPSDVVKVRPRYPRIYTDREDFEQDVEQIPTMPPATAIWQYETPRYEAESSLSSLSLAISEATRIHRPAIDQIKTLPPTAKTRTTGDIIKKEQKEHLLVNTQEIDITEIKTAPDFTQRQDLRRAGILHPLERLRWWLLAPGRIEFILWICGTVVLICVTVALLFMMAVSMGFFRSGAPQSTINGSICSAEGGLQKRTGQAETCTLSTVSSSTGLRVTMINGDVAQTGKVLRLRGQGFHPHGRISITRDGNIPCRPNITQANEQGEFAVALQLDDKGYWGAGRHQISIDDIESKHSIIVNILLEPGK